MANTTHAITKLKRNKMIRELNNSGYSNEDIYRFMGHKQVTIRTIQGINKIKRSW